MREPIKFVKKTIKKRSLFPKNMKIRFKFMIQNVLSILWMGQQEIQNTYRSKNNVNYLFILVEAQNFTASLIYGTGYGTLFYDFNSQSNCSQRLKYEHYKMISKGEKERKDAIIK